MNDPRLSVPGPVPETPPAVRPIVEAGGPERDRVIERHRRKLILAAINDDERPGGWRGWVQTAKRGVAYAGEHAPALIAAGRTILKVLKR